MKQSKLYYFALFLAAYILMVIVVGAWVRLTDAGLGCPDWPGCYGFVGTPESAEAIALAEARFPEQPVEQGKAWREMFHRYVAGVLGVLILLFAFFNWKQRTPARNIAGSMVLLVVFQALLGMWTVTLLLKPAVVLMHLLGGMSLLALAVWAMRRLSRTKQVVSTKNFRRFAALALIVLFAQISLGGWTSTNYAALACPDFPACQGSYWPEADYAHGFNLIERHIGELGDEKALVAIHWVHRLGAVFASLVLLSFAFVAWRRYPPLRAAAVVLASLLVIQVSVAIAMVLKAIPLDLAVAHNGIAALLVACLLWLNASLASKH